MRAKHIFRIDDVCENMNWSNFNRIKALFHEYDVKPVIGVIPDNQDPQLLKFETYKGDFWGDILTLQKEKGWSVAMHGYIHVYKTPHSGLLKINKRSEFAGLLKEVQGDKIRKGKEILNQHGLVVDAFMAPSHSFDHNTIECLLEADIHVITDGYSYFPYEEKGMLYIPQLFAQPRRQKYGVFTWCLHTNAMSEGSLLEIEQFVRTHKADIIAFSEAKEHIKSGLILRVQKRIIRIALLTMRSFK